MTDRILVAYGTKHGATAEIAEAIGGVLRVAGFEVDVRGAGTVRSLEPYRAVVLGSAVYAGRWRRDAMRLLRRPQMKDRDVWLFSSGPVGEDKGDPAEVEKWTKPRRVRDLERAIGAHGDVVFGGKIDEQSGFMRKRMARDIPPELRDRRDWDQIEAWTRSIAARLAQSAVG
jgi:menaquinone-dependent protoporphyrinogen oxidase